MSGKEKWPEQKKICDWSRLDQTITQERKRLKKMDKMETMKSKEKKEQPRRIVFVFPGLGYHADKPLLYHAGKLARELGYDAVIRIAYGGFAWGVKGNPEKMREAFESALAQAEEIAQREAGRILQETGTGPAAGQDQTQETSSLAALLSGADDILVLSKSIGTAVAAAFQQRHSISARNIYFTPVRESFLFIPVGSGIVFHGTADSWAETEDIRCGCEDLDLPLYVTEGADHSMETGNTDADLSILREIMGSCAQYLLSSRRLPGENT